MSTFEDEFFFVEDPDEEDIPSNVPREILPVDSKNIRRKPKNLSDELSSGPMPSQISRQKLERLYNRISEHLSPEQRRYTKKVINGTIGVDTMYEMEILVRQLSLIFTAVSLKAFEEERVTRDFAAFTDSYRQAIKDLNEFVKDAREAENEDQNVSALSVADRQREVAKLDRLLQVSGNE